MLLQAPHALLPLNATRPQRLAGARGLTLRARRGTLWITLDHDPRDIVLREGEQWVVDSDGPLLASPLGGAATLELCDSKLRRREQSGRDWLDVLDALWNREGRRLSAAVIPA